MSSPASKREFVPYKEISMSQVAMHDTIDDCWVVLFNKVYDVTDFVHYVSQFNSKLFKTYVFSKVKLLRGWSEIYRIPLHCCVGAYWME